MDNSEYQKNLVTIILLALIPLGFDVAGIIMDAMGNYNYKGMYIISVLLWAIIIVATVNSLYKKKELDEIIKEKKFKVIKINELYLNKSNLIHIQVFYDSKDKHNSFIYWLDASDEIKNTILNNFNKGKFTTIKLYMDPYNVNTQKLDMEEVCKQNGIKDVTSVKLSSSSINGVRFL